MADHLRGQNKEDEYMENRHIVIQANELYHYGVQDMKWGKRRWQYEDGSLTPAGRIHYGVGQGYKGKQKTPESKAKYKDPESMMKDMAKTFKYKDYTKLQSPEETWRTKKGSCHDQMLAECEQLRKMGYEPHGKFIFEHDGKGQGGMTHSFAWIKNGNEYWWIENAWSERSGINKFPSMEAMNKAIRQSHQTGEYGDKNTFSKMEIVDFDPSIHKPGEDLQEFVDKCFGD